MRHPTIRRTTLKILATAAIAALGLTACGDTGDADTADGTPQSIISLSPTATEMLFAVGAGEQVVAVDDRSSYPADAPRTKLSGYTPNLEAILGYSPDLVVLADDNDDIVAGLERAGVQVLQLPAAANLDDTYTQIEQVGAASGHVGDAAELVGNMRSEIDELFASVPERETPLSYFHELDNTFYTVTDDSFIGQIYRELGLRSIATGSAAYPQLSAEFIIAADPDVIFLADSQCCGVTAESVAARAGWGGLTAVRDGHVYDLDEDLSSRWGPRVVDLVRELAGIVTTIPASQPAS